MTGFLHKHTLTLAEMTWVSQKVIEIKQHAGWHDNIDEITAERLLMREPVFTYLLRSGKDMYHYYLSVVGLDGVVHHKPVKIELSAHGWLYRQGGSIIRENINDLVHFALHCKPEACKPYRAVKAPVFSL